MPSLSNETKNNTKVAELARQRLLCSMLFGAGGEEEYEALTGRRFGQFSLCVMGLEGGKVPIAEAAGVISALPCCREAAVFASAADRIVVLEETGTQTGRGEPRADAVKRALLERYGADAGISAEEARGRGADALQGGYRSCDRMLRAMRLAHAEQESGRKDRKGGSVKPVLAKAMEYIEAHYCEPITLEEVAERAFASPYYISRLFKRETGLNFVNYVAAMRIEKAKRLLEDTELRVFEVAEAAGIADAHYFSKLFRKREGLSPSEYRAAGRS